MRFRFSCVWAYLRFIKSSFCPVCFTFDLNNNNSKPSGQNRLSYDRSSQKWLNGFVTPSTPSTPYFFCHTNWINGMKFHNEGESVVRNSISLGWRWYSISVPNHCHILSFKWHTTHASYLKCQIKFTIKVKQNVDLHIVFYAKIARTKRKFNTSVNQFRRSGWMRVQNNFQYYRNN